MLVRPAIRPLALAAVAALALTACSTADDGTASGPTILTSVYPLQYVVEQVAGDLAVVESLTPAGADPHSLELSPRVAREIGEADAVVTLSGFQAAVDTAVAERSPTHQLDAADVVDLHPAGEDGHDHDTDHADGDEDGDDGHDHGTLDPHFWLDPTALAAVGDAVGGLLAEVDPDNAATYAANAATLRADLTDLDTTLRTGLADCERDVVVVTHAAFGYLTEAYGLTQVGIAGIDPETEPSPARLREIRDVVTEHGVTALYTEVLLGPGVVGALAGDLGVETLVLDPIETQASATSDYRGAMLANLEALRAGLGCA